MIPRKRKETFEDLQRVLNKHGPSQGLGQVEVCARALVVKRGGQVVVDALKSECADIMFGLSRSPLQIVEQPVLENLDN
jgi:hypothetical protein